MHAKYQTLCSIHYGETAFQKLEQKIDQKFEKLNEHIIYAPDLQVVVDTNQTTQQIYEDRKQVHDALEPVQRALNQDILSSAMILTPEKMQQALIKNPFEVFNDVRPVDFFDSSRLPPEGVPVMFEIDGTKYLGWQLKGTLPFLFNCRYDELWIPPAPQIISTPISLTVSKPDSIHQPTWNFIVSPNSEYSTINSALKVARNGDKILVKTGLYKEKLVINKNIELIADGLPIIESGQDCITMDTDHALIKGFTIQSKARYRKNKVAHGVFAYHGKLVLDSCDITSDSASCIHISNSQTTMRHCNIHNSDQEGICISSQSTAFIQYCKIYSNRSSGISIYRADAQIEDCEIFGNLYRGIQIYEEGNTTVRRCIIKHNSYSAIYVYNNKVIVEDCDLRKNENGTWDIDETSQVQKRNNQE